MRAITLVLLITLNLSAINKCDLYSKVAVSSYQKFEELLKVKQVLKGCLELQYSISNAINAKHECKDPHFKKLFTDLIKRVTPINEQCMNKFPSIRD